MLKLVCFIVLMSVIVACGSKKSEPELKPKSEQNENEIGKKPIVDQQTTLKFSNVVEFYKKDQSSIAVKVALAVKPEERNAGLMGVTKLDPKTGMLFLFEKQEPLSFWMANTPLSLDIIFVDEEYKIVRIHSNTEPFSTKQYESVKPAKFVIEVAGGFCVENDIIEGTEVGFDV